MIVTPDVEDVLRFHEFVRVFIGSSDEEGAESFDVSVSSPSWIEAQCEEKGYWLARWTLVLSHWDVSLIRRAVHETVMRVTGDSWEAIAEQLSTFMTWEFENYQDYKESPE
jgi:hypothetical protein